MVLLLLGLNFVGQIVVGYVFVLLEIVDGGYVIEVSLFEQCVDCVVLILVMFDEQLVVGQQVCVGVGDDYVDVVQIIGFGCQCVGWFMVQIVLKQVWVVVGDVWWVVGDQCKVLIG